MNPIDHSLTHVLLIGASEFSRDPDIRPIPNVAANLRLLRECLINPDIVGIPQENITLLLNENKLVIERQLLRVVRETKTRDHTLLVYYSGHGMLSNTEYGLFLTTSDTQGDTLEIDGIDIEDFKKFFKRSSAGVKIAILDCCHSGGIFNTMGNMPSAIQASIKGFEGTYIMTSAAEDKPALFPENQPEIPTYFTGKLIDVLQSGKQGAGEYCSLREIYDQVDIYCRDHIDPPLPRPQQGNFLNADQLYFSRNKQFLPSIPHDQAAWENAQRVNDKWVYVDFRENFPNSIYQAEAFKKIMELEEEEEWNRAIARNSVSQFYHYIDSYPNGKFAAEARENIRLLREAAMPIEPPRKEVPPQVQEPKITPPDMVDAEKERAQEIEAKTQRARTEQEEFWHSIQQRNNIDAYEIYLTQYPNGKYVNEAQERLEQIRRVQVDSTSYTDADQVALTSMPEVTPGRRSYVYPLLITVGVILLIITIFIVSNRSGSNKGHLISIDDIKKAKHDSSAAADSVKLLTDSAAAARTPDTMTKK